MRSSLLKHIGSPYKLVHCPFFSYRGGKALLRRYIIRWIRPSGFRYIEPFAGRANLFFLARCFADYQYWQLNDISTTSFFQALLRYEGEKLPLLSKEEAVEMFESGNWLHYLLEPIYFWAGGLAPFASSTGSRGHNLNQYRRRLLRAKRLLKDVKITSLNALDVISKYAKDKETFLYIDPPYQSGNVACYTAEDYNRRELLTLLHTSKCKWLLSEYRCDDILDLFGEPFTTIKNVKVNPNPKSKKVKIVEECLWANYKMEKPLFIDFEDSEHPLQVSKFILQKERKISFEQWEGLVPKRWSEGTVKAQFKRLCVEPGNYYDGEFVQLYYELDESSLFLIKN